VRNRIDSLIATTKPLLRSHSFCFSNLVGGFEQVGILFHFGCDGHVNVLEKRSKFTMDESLKLFWRVFFTGIRFCGRVFSQTTLDSIIQPNGIWKRRVQSVLLAGSGFPVFIRTGKTAGQISGPYPCNVKNGYVHFRLRLIPEVRT